MLSFILPANLTPKDKKQVASKRNNPPFSTKRRQGRIPEVFLFSEGRRKGKNILRSREEEGLLPSIAIPQKEGGNEAARKGKTLLFGRRRDLLSRQPSENQLEKKGGKPPARPTHEEKKAQEKEKFNNGTTGVKGKGGKNTGQKLRKN